MRDHGFLLESMTWEEAQRALSSRPVGLLPVGAVEAHGPHLPLDSDVIIARATAVAAAGRLRELDVPAIVLPSLAYSISFVGTSFAGTSPVDPIAFESYLTSTLVHLADGGYRALVVCNAHLEPAHVERVQLACRAAESACGTPVRSPDQRSERFSSFLSAEFQAGSRHAGSYETSIVLAAQPESVRSELLPGLPPVWIDLPARLRAGARTFADAGASLGYFGDPARATPEEGQAMLRALAEMVVTVCREAGVVAADEYQAPSGVGDDPSVSRQ